MNITKIALSYNQVTLLIIGIITVLGLTGYNQLSRDAMPPYTIRVCSIVTTFPGASPERVETLVTDKIEKVIQEIPELKTVTSESRTSLSIIKAEIKPDIQKENLQDIWDRIRRKVDAIKPELPDNIFGPDIKDDGLGVVYGIQIGLEADGYTYAEMKEYADEIRDDLIRLKEASRVEIKGAQEEQIFIEYDNASLAQYGISSNQIKSSISSTNIVFPGGQVGLVKERIVIEPTGNFEKLEDVKNTLISIGRNEKVKLGNIANVRLGYKHPKESIVKINGNNGLVIAVALQEGANLTTLGETIDAMIMSYNNTLPFGMSVRRVASQDTYVNTKVNDFVGNVIQSIGIVLLVMLLFLGLRTGLVVASLIPLAMVMSLMIMNMMGVGLNQVTLASLIMALGMLVDNAIVVSESILVRLEKGENAKEAAISSSRELAIPLLISTLTTSAAFLAFFLAENTMGEMMGNIFIVITIALLSSWILALSIVAMLAVYFMKVKPKSVNGKKKSIFDRLNIGYTKILLSALKFPKISIIIIIGMFIASLILFPMLPFIFMPDSDRNLVVVDVDLPLGSKIEETEKVMDRISDFIGNELFVPVDSIEDKAGVESWASFISKGPNSYDLGYQPGQTNSGYAHMLINTTTFEANPGIIAELDKFTFEQFPNAEISVSPLSGAGGAKYDVGVRITGEDSEELLQLAQFVKNKMTTLEGAKNIKDDWGPKIKKVRIDIDQDKAGRAGVTNQDIALSLQTALSGMDIGDYRDLDGNIPIIMTNLERNNIDVHALGSINIFSQMTGRNVPLIQVANIELDWQIAKNI
jgi:multidrug efflux pump subunit AcrB